MGYPDCYITTMRIYCKKVGHHRKQACFIDVEGTASPQRYIYSEQIDLIYNNITY